MEWIGWRALCLLLGYLPGCLLTAEMVAWLATGKSVREIGTGNPGMANVMAALGKPAGFTVLFGDAAKTALACCLGYLVAGPKLGCTALLYAGFGAILGHNFPFWRKFCGGKGVTTTCVWLMLLLPCWGFVCCALGGVVVLLTGYLPLGAVLIPILAVPFAFWQGGAECGVVVLLSALIMWSRHWQGLARMLHGNEPKTFRKKAH